MKRIHSLDAIRGLAALVVVLHHSLLSVSDGQSDPHIRWIYLSPLRLFVDGPGAVLIFFVLSGLVLTFTLKGRNPDTYAAFVLKRISRIYPAVVFAILVSALLQSLLGAATLPDLSRWFAFTWAKPVSGPLLLEAASLSGFGLSLDNPLWSLVHEMRISLVLPLLVLLASRSVWVAGVVTLVVFVISVRVAGKAQGELIHSIAMTGEFLVAFLIGVLLAIYFSSVTDWLATRRSGVKAALWIAALTLVAFPPVNASNVGGLREAVLILSSCFGALIIIALSSIDGRANRWLMGPVPAYFGRISYSLYLIHVVIIVAVVRALHSSVSIFASLCIAVTASILIADLMQRFVEKPFTNFGRTLAGKLKSAPATTTILADSV